MWFIGVEVEQQTSAPPHKKKILDPPLYCLFKVASGCNTSMPYVTPVS